MNRPAGRGGMIMKDITFEQALTDLEHIVEKLEKGGLNLNESLSLFEKGVRLARFLRDELEKAEKKIEILLKDEKGGTKRATFDLEAAEGLGGEAEEEIAEDNKEESGAKKPRTKGPKKEGGDDDTLPF
jgi:exodeoxyribonuclease VII small subunit